MRKLFIYVLIVTSFSAFVACDENTTNPSGESPATRFEDYLNNEIAVQNIPAMSVVVFDDKQILHEYYVGLSNIEQGIELQPDHLFLLASASKVFTATALLQLYEDGGFELDDNISDYLPFDVASPNHSEPITFQMLLTHTSGIADGSVLDDQYFYGEDSNVELADFMENYFTPSGKYYNATENFHDFAPGSDYEYSNTGSALIAVLVEEISREGFNQYCKKNIFQPLNMSETSWRLDEISQTIVTPYKFDGEYEAIQHYTFTDYPNGGLRSTGRDLYKFLSAFLNDGKSNNYQLLQKSTIDQILTPQISDIYSSMGLHFFNMDVANGLWGHDGSEQGVATVMAFNPLTKVGAIVLSNQRDGSLNKILVEAYKLGIN